MKLRQPLCLMGALLAVPPRAPAVAAAEGATADELLTAFNAERSARDGAPLRFSRTCPSWLGENLAQGQPSVEEVLGGWLASPEHRENILDRAFRDMGLGFAYGKNDNGYQVLWVQLFAKPRG